MKKKKWIRSKALVIAMCMTCNLFSAFTVSAKESSNTANTSSKPSKEQQEFVPDVIDDVRDVDFQVPMVEKSNTQNYNASDILPSQSAYIPSSYDSRDVNSDGDTSDGVVTYPKNQNPYGTCWAHTAASVSESSMIINNVESYTVNSLDISETQLAYFATHGVNDPLGNTAGDSIAILNGNYLDVGNNNVFTTFALAKWAGVADQLIVTPNSSIVDSKYAYNYDIGHLQNAYWINASNVNEAKNLIMNCGSLCANIDYQDGYHNYATGAYYCPSSSGSNHAITIVGWDDNYSRNNFVYTPSSDGAWLCKNSWGTDWGKNSGGTGYFWVSYKDYWINNSNQTLIAYDIESSDNYDNNYQYDGSTGISAVGINSNGKIANIYTANANSGGTETLEAVAFATNSTNVNYSIQIYKNLKKNNDPESGTACLRTPVTGVSTYAGYKTAKLSTPVTLNEGDTFAVVITLTNSQGSTNVFVDATYTNGNWIRFTSSAKAGQSFYKNSSSAAWRDFKSLSSLNYCARIKAFTTNSTNQTPADPEDPETPEDSIESIKLNETSIEIKEGDVYNIIATINPADMYDKISWSSSDKSVATVKDMGDGVAAVTGVTGGTAQITASADNGVKAWCTVTVISNTAEEPEDPDTPEDVIELDETSIKLTPDEYTYIEAAVYPEELYDDISWSSSNESVAVVEDAGDGVAFVIGVSGGTATITAKTSNGATASCTVTVSYKITYKLNGGKNAASNPNYYYNQQITLKSPTRKGYIFGGWYTSSNYKNKITSISKGTNQNYTLYAKWTKVSLAKASINKAKNSYSKAIILNIKKVSGALGYEVVYSTKKNFNSYNSGTTAYNEVAVTGLKKGKTYYIKVRAYKKDSTGSIVYGQYSAVKKVKVTK